MKLVNGAHAFGEPAKRDQDLLSRFLTVKEQGVLVFLGVSILVGGLALYIHDKSDSGPAIKIINAPAPEPPPSGNSPVQLLIPDPEEPDGQPEPPIQPPQHVSVSVMGAVDSPGMYSLSGERRVQDLIDRAGGLQEGADLSNINLAAKLIDGTTLTVPRQYTIQRTERGAVIQGRRNKPIWNPRQYTLSGWQPETASQIEIETNGRTGQAGARIDINRATADQLQTLPGIGPVYAAAIVEHRRTNPFKTPEDLLEVSGIGPKRLEAIRKLIVIK